jgi:hypothetical protein
MFPAAGLYSLRQGTHEAILGNGFPHVIDETDATLSEFGDNSFISRRFQSLSAGPRIAHIGPRHASYEYFRCTGN